MNFDYRKSEFVFGKVIGYLFAYAISTIVLYLLFFLTNKLPQNNPYFIVIEITIAISTSGIVIRKLLK